MTLEQACGIVCNTVDKRTGRELDHREIYVRYIDYLGGLDKVKPYIPFELDYLAPKYREDPLLNKWRSCHDARFYHRQYGPRTRRYD